MAGLDGQEPKAARLLEMARAAVAQCGERFMRDAEVNSRIT